MSSSSPALRSQVLRLYKEVLRLGRTWEASTGRREDTTKERAYIKDEASTLFRQNKGLSDPKVIQDRIQEARARVDLAVHYKTPYPRPVYVPPKSMIKKKGKEQGKVQERIKKESIPAYMKSHFDR